MRDLGFERFGFLSRVCFYICECVKYMLYGGIDILFFDVAFGFCQLKCMTDYL